MEIRLSYFNRLRSKSEFFRSQAECVEDESGIYLHQRQNEYRESPMKKNQRASFLNAIFITLVAIQTFTVVCPIGVSGQTGQPADPSSYGMTSGRLGATVAAVLGLIGVVIGLLALARPSGRFGTASGRLGAIVALAAGLIGMALGGLVVATSGGRIGTGGGLAGAIVALVLGLIAMAVGGLALARARRTG
jgi:uncharacterized BrkB/YihY/UPF0761 family membrane protein